MALAATRAYRDAGWAWLKALLGISVFAATLMVVGGLGVILSGVYSLWQGMRERREKQLATIADFEAMCTAEK